MPTQAQIEAAAKAICRQYEIEDGFSEEQANKSANSEMAHNFMRTAKAALAAAAEVGAQTSNSMGDDWDGTNEYNRKHAEIRAAKLATIERCARVAEGAGYVSGSHIAAAIRALKDHWWLVEL